MRAVVLSEQGPELELAELPDPEPEAGQALIRVSGCGICGSDLHIASQLAPAGTVLGHEIAGTVEALGPGVDAADWTIGETVAVRPFAGCGSCVHCRRGRADHCDDFELLGLARPGGFSELTVARADELFRLPAAVTGPEQALVEPLAIARRAIRRGGVVPTDSMHVIGAGPIGQAIIVWARYLGVSSITVSDPAASRRELALQLGATRAVDPVADDMGMLELALAGSSVVFECAGKPGMVNHAMDLAAIDGRVVVVGVCLSDDVTVPYTGLRKELDVRYALYYDRGDWVDTIAALEAHGLGLDGFVSEVVGLDALPTTFARLLAGAEGGKVVLQP